MFNKWLKGILLMLTLVGLTVSVSAADPNDIGGDPVRFFELSGLPGVGDVELAQLDENGSLTPSGIDPSGGIIGGSGTQYHIPVFDAAGTGIGDTNYTIQSNTFTYTNGSTFRTSLNGTSIEVVDPNTTYTAFDTYVWGDANTRFGIKCTGLQSWGDGTGAHDLTLGRGAAGRLDLGAGMAFVIPGGAGDFASPINGMLWYNQTTNKLRGYEGGGWQNLVQTGGGASPLTTKGDIYVYSTADDRLPVGTDGKVLTADSGTATGLNWLTPATGTVHGTGTDNQFVLFDGTGDIKDSSWAEGGSGQMLGGSGTDTTRINKDGGIVLTHTLTTPLALQLMIGSESFARFDALAGGTLEWGGGSGAVDVALSRGAASRLDLASGDTFLLDILQLLNGGTIDTSTGVGNGFKVRAYATTGAVRQDMITVTNGALACLLDFPQGATWNGNYIYHATGTDVPVTDGGTGASTAAAALTNLGAGPPYSSIMLGIMPKVDNTQVSSGVSDTTYAIYIGKCPKATTSFIIRVRTTTAYGTGGVTPWAEVGIATGTPTAATNPVLTVIGTTDVSGTYNAAAGNKTTTITATAAAGDDLWFLHGSKGTTPYLLRGCRSDEIGGGGFGAKAATGPISGIGAGTTFSINTTASPGYVQVFPQ